MTGGTGHVGGELVKELLKRGADVRVLHVIKPKTKAILRTWTAGGDMLDPVSLEEAMKSVGKTKHYHQPARRI